MHKFAIFNAPNYGLKKNSLKGKQSAVRRCIYATFRAINSRGSLTSLLKSPSIRWPALTVAAIGRSMFDPADESKSTLTSNDAISNTCTTRFTFPVVPIWDTQELSFLFEYRSGRRINLASTPRSIFEFKYSHLICYLCETPTCHIQRVN